MTKGFPSWYIKVISSAPKTTFVNYGIRNISELSGTFLFRIIVFLKTFTHT